MKKVLLLSCAFWIGSQLVAQQNTISPVQPSFQTSVPTTFPTYGNNKGVVRRDAGNDWYNTVGDVRTAGETFVYFGDFAIWPDSLPVLRYSTGPQHAFVHGAGAMLDPKAFYYTTPLTRYQNYSIDSFYFIYKYYNPVPGYTDSLIIQVYDDQGIANLNFGAGNPSAAPVLKGFRGVGAKKEFGYLLDTGSSTSNFFNQTSASYSDVFVQALSPAVTVRELDGAGTGRNGLFAFTFFVKPNYSYKFGDTIVYGRDSSRATDPKTLLTCFQPFVLQAQTALEDQKTSFNYLLANYTPQRYSTRTTEWFFPGNPPSTARRYLDAGFHLNYFNLGTRFNDLGADISNVFPNPAKRGGEMNVQLKLKETTNVTVNVYNAQGQMVKAIASGTYGPGVSTVHFNIDDLAAGTYYIKMSGNFGVVSQTMLVH